MHTPSGRFQPSTRLCLSISDFHPKSFNPAWEVSTILIGLMSFMTSDEMTTGSLSAGENERKWLAARSRWWNSTGGGSSTNPTKGNTASIRGVGAVKAGDGGVKFRAEWPELDEENWTWMQRNRVDAATGRVLPDPPQVEGGESANKTCDPQVVALRRGPGGMGTHAVLGDAGRAARQAGQGWVGRHKLLVAGAVLIGWVLLTRLVNGGGNEV
ncbi:hypothetical protein N7G274_000616 [Stereocaulon virgatum]|uniref:UBC core domain-containing protein n=1 Tax=Stereocaulon virgatum TaxID=373712 RepID=A0ABR4AQ22_9LECA